MMTKDQYIESLRKLNLNLYMFGKKVENPVDDPVIRPSLNSFAATYELAEDPQYQDRSRRSRIRALSVLYLSPVTLRHQPSELQMPPVSIPFTAA